MDAAQDQIVAGLSCYLFKIHFYTCRPHTPSRNLRHARVARTLSICTLWRNLFIYRRADGGDQSHYCAAVNANAPLFAFEYINSAPPHRHCRARMSSNFSLMFYSV
jgi:hypothetical protein